MTEKRKNKSTKPTEIPERYSAGYLDVMDGRTEPVRTARYSLARLTSDLGGAGNISYMEQILEERIVHIKSLAEQTELRLLNGKKIDVNEYLMVVNCLSGLLSKIGLKRRARKIPSLDEYLKRTPEPQAPLPAPSGPLPQQEV